MDFRKSKANAQNLYLRETHLENIFIMEYMPDADAVCIKVYLTALMYADREDMNNSLIARHLGIEEEEVLRAWTYWEKKGVIKKHYPDPDDRFHYIVEFLDLREQLYSGGNSAEKSKSSDAYDSLLVEMDDNQVREIFDAIQEITGRLLEGRESQAVVSLVYEEGVDPGLIIYAYKYCAEKRKNNRFSYISAVIREWLKDGVKTKADAEKFLAENDLRYNQYRRVMKALGFHRTPTENEQEKIDSWFDDMGFNIDRVLEACARTSGISNPNINYVNSILSSWHNGNTGEKRQNASGGTDDRKNAVTQVKKMYEEIRKKNRTLQSERQAEIYRKLPRVKEIEEELRSLSMNMTRLALKGGNSGVTANELKKKITDLNAEKAFLLTEQNLPYDYLELQYDCNMCKDTGVMENGERCRCFSEKLKQFVR